MQPRSRPHARPLPFRRPHLRALLLLLLPALLLSEPRDPPGGEVPAGERRPFNSYLPQLLAVSGVTATGDDSVDAALQAAAASHFQGWFERAAQAYAGVAAAAPTNRDAYLGMSYATQLRGCDEAARALRTFLRLHREQGPLHRRDVRCRRAPTMDMQSPVGKVRVWIDNGDFVSPETFRSAADHVLDEFFCHFDPAAVQRGDKVFVNTFLLCPFVKALHPLIQHPYSLVTHNSDFPAPRMAEGLDYTPLLDSSKLVAWFAQNPTAHHPKLLPLPQGLSVNTKTLASDWHPSLAISVSRNISEVPVLDGRKGWLYVNFAVRKDAGGADGGRRGAMEWARRQAEGAAEGEVTVREGKVSQEEYRADVKGHRFVLCPPGNGFDTHRVYETLQLGAIPVVMGTEALSGLYARFPALDAGPADPPTLTLAHLKEAYPALLERTRDMWRNPATNPLGRRFWEDLIRRETAQRLFSGG